MTPISERPAWSDYAPWALMIGGDGIAVWRGYLAAWWYRQWQAQRAFDPAAAERYYANAQGEAVLSALALAVAYVGVALFLRGRRRRRPAGE